MKRRLLRGALAAGVIAAALPAAAQEEPQPARRDDGAAIFAGLSPSQLSKDGRSADWPNSFALELTVAAPAPPEREGLFRPHHRSGAFGAINGSTNGADFLSVGARYRP